MASSKKVNSNFSGEILHYVGVRIRVSGSGNLNLSIINLNDVDTHQLNAIPMQSTPNKEPLVLCNVTEQMAYLEFKTTEIDEVFTISKITIFAKPSGTGYPQ